MIRTFILILGICTTIQVLGQTNLTPMRTIEVTGTAKKSTVPQSIVFTISFQEYWKEEFEGKKYEDYRTKIEIETIEQALISELRQIGVAMDQITLKQTGNYWRRHGKDFLVSKTLDIELEDFARANLLSTHLKTRGIQSMNVSKLEHDDIDAIELETKMAAIEAAKSKAIALASTLGKKIKDVVTVIELDQYMHVQPRPIDGMVMARSAGAEMAADRGVEYENFRMIETKASVRVIFELE